MNLVRRTPVLAASALSAGLWALACGDGGTEPPAPDPPRPATLTVSPGAVQIAALGATARLGVEVLDQNGNAIAEAVVNWSSGAPAVAAVDAAGLVTAEGSGTATITATLGSTSGSAAVTVRVENGDRAVLVALYEATDGPNWVNSENWLTDAPLGDWYGVETDADGRVVALALGGFWREDEYVSNGLSGVLPPELGGLTRLATLDLDGNDLRGAIPRELGGLENLRQLDLRWNRLSEEIPPELGQLAQLADLKLYGNNLSGPIPPQLGDLSSLRYLGLGSNQLSGPIPPELGGLSGLDQLGLHDNHLSGPIPPALAGLASLTEAYLGGNDLSGEIPSELGNLTSIRYLGLGANRLSGPVPPELGRLASLSGLRLDQNELTGPIPSKLLELVNLDRFHFTDNNGLCAPGTVAFSDWLGDLGVAEGPFCNQADREALVRLFETAGGTDWTVSDGWPEGYGLHRWHGVSADSLGRVTRLDLSDNALAGRLPASLGQLARMTGLRIGGNAELSGRLPLAFRDLFLHTLHYGGTGLCAPADDSFNEWLNGIPSHEGTGAECAPLSEREILEILYESADGPGWSRSDNWLTDAPLGAWHGVEVDGEGRVEGLVLPYNGLSGRIPPELGGLARLRILVLVENGLSGPIPPELGGLAGLEELWLYANELSGPIPPELGDLGNLERLIVRDNRLSGGIPSQLGSLAELRSLDVGDNSLTGPIPPELRQLTRLERLSLHDNSLSGPIPPELGDLVNLEDLILENRRNTAPILPELGNLANLRRLILHQSATGPIPPELGNLAKLTHLELRGTELSGPLPAALGNLVNLEHLVVQGANLSGPIPPALGNLASLTRMDLGRNELSGPIPAALGNLSNLSTLSLNSNELSGPLPPELGNLSDLRHLGLANNTALEGALPSELTGLAHLEAFYAGGTGLCAPADPAIQTWLAGVDQKRVSVCGAAAVAAFLTQAVQSREFPVPLVAGERALLRVFPTAGRMTDAGIPPVRARFYRDGRETHSVDIPGKSTPIPTEIDEGDLAKSVNSEIPGTVVQPGLEMVIEVDPEGALDASLGVAGRIPAEGRLAVAVREVPLFDLTLIPYVWEATRDSSVVDMVAAVEADPVDHRMLADLRELLPVAELEVTAHEPVLSSSNNAFTLLAQTEAIRAMEGGSGHYMGLMTDVVTGIVGVANLAGYSSFARANPGVIAHELGHNMSLGHAPCNVGGEPLYPYPDGSIGAWGYDFAEARLVPPSNPDLMSYCRPRWISDYSFSKALDYRLRDATAARLAIRPPASRSLLVWGGIGTDSLPFLEPAFVVDAPPALPDSEGEYRLTGRTADGRVLFSLSFAMPVLAHGDGRSSFAFVLPARADWQGGLASITLSGPGGAVTLDSGTELPMAILRDPQSGRVRGFLRDPPPATQMAADEVGQAAGRRLETLFSRGIPPANVWRR